jgi:membrane fusion protein (multidrug efflux system)
MNPLHHDLPRFLRGRVLPVIKMLAGLAPLVPPALMALLLTACQGEIPAAQNAVPEVTVALAVVKDVPVAQDFVGRVAAFRSVEVRAQVEGLVVKRSFEEGTDVKKGELLYQIDPRPLTAALEEAKAKLARSEAVQDRAKQKVSRLKPLAEANAISREDFDEAVAGDKEAAAELLGSKAAVEQAQLNLSFARVTAPEGGRIGRALVPEGRLVGKEGPTHLATIDKIDPIYVTFTVTDKDALMLDKAVAAGQIKLHEQRKIPIRLRLPDDTAYDAIGRFDFASATVNPETGTFTVRAEFPNPRLTLAPGMFVRVNVEAGQWPKAVLVPQRAVLKAPKGHYLYVVDKSNKVERRDVFVGEWYEADWIIEKGLAAGESVIVDGLQAVTPGIAVKPVTANPPSAQEQAKAQAAAPTQAPAPKP